MDQMNLGYSTKNIPLPSRKNYLQRLIERTEKFTRAIRWRAFFFLNPNASKDTKETFGFNTTKPPPQSKELKEFEVGLQKLVQNIEFKNSSDNFQQKLSKDLEDIKNSEHVIVSADKTTNHYKVKPNDYKSLVEKNITKDYKKAKVSTENDINRENSKVADNLGLANRINVNAKNQCFITLKDHKQNFPNNPSCRLINPSKSEIGIISKKILQKIISRVKEATNLNQWKNTAEVIDWFKAIESKATHNFICFDVVEFYPSITQELLQQSLEFAENYIDISDEEKEIITLAKKSLLYNQDIAWSKKGNENFDVTMGSYDGAETCELVGLFILSHLQNLNINVGLYRDDGLATSNMSPRETEKTKKKICKIFEKLNLKITIEANLKSVDFLDITMDLSSQLYKPYMKPNNRPLYVNKNSNHPPSILKNIPESVNKRLSSISANENIFNEASQPYQEALKDSGYDYKMKFKPQQPNSNNKRNRKRRITWFNPPFSKNVKTNVGKKFLELVDKCFPPNNKLHKIINRNTVKVSYSCMDNIKQEISKHNKSVLNENNPNEIIPVCKHKKGNVCPLGGKCKTKGVIYQAKVTRTDNSKEETYVGLAATEFMARYNNHKSSFKKKEDDAEPGTAQSTSPGGTALSQYIISLNDKNIDFTLSWKIIDRGKPYSPESNRCRLCLKEKYYIVCKPGLATLNKRSEMFAACRHRSKFLLSEL